MPARSPVELVELSARVVGLAEELGNPNLAADVAAAVESARTAAVIAGVNLRVNVAGLADPAVRERFAAVVGRVEAVVERAGRVCAAVVARIGP